MSGGRQTLAAFRCRGLSWQANRCGHCRRLSMKRDGYCYPVPTGGFSGWAPEMPMFLSTGTSLPLLCRTWKGDIRGGGGWHLALIRWIHLPLHRCLISIAALLHCSSISIAVTFPQFFIRARSDHFPLPSSSSLATITPGFKESNPCQ